MQLYIVAVKTGIGKIPDPVAEIDIAAVIRKREIKRVMPVAENKIIVMLLLQYFFTINDQPFFFFPHKLFIGRSCFYTALTAEIICQRNAPGRVQLPE